MNDDFKMKNDFKINSKQLTFFMFAAILEIDSLTTFGWLTKLAGPDAWLAIVFALVLIAPGTTLIALLGRRFPRESIIEYSQRTFGRLIGILIGLFYAGFWTLMAAKVLRQNTDLVNTFLLFRTPREAVMLIMLITVAYLIRNGLTPITKLNVFLFPLMFLPLAVSAFLSLRDFDYTNFFPFLTRGIRPVLEGALLVAGAFQGLEILLILMPFVIDQRNTVKASIFAVLLIWVPSLFEMIAVLGVLGPEEASRQLYPTVSLIKASDFPGAFVERLEPLFLLGWIVAAFTTVYINFYLAGLALARLLGIREAKIMIYPLAPAILTLAMLPPNILVTINWANQFAFFSLIPLYLLPLTVYFVAFLRGKGERKRREKTRQVA